jgi:hypothetical protein
VAERRGAAAGVEEGSAAAGARWLGPRRALRPRRSTWRCDAGTGGRARQRGAVAARTSMLAVRARLGMGMARRSSGAEAERRSGRGGIT